MEQLADYGNFTHLLRRICTTLEKYDGADKFDPLLETWWKALRHVPFKLVEAHVEDFLATADKETPFPRPAQMRPKDMAPPSFAETAFVGNPARDYWRSSIVHECAKNLGHDWSSMMRTIEMFRETLGRALLDLLNECCDREIRGGRTTELHQHCLQRCQDIARAYPQVAKAGAQALRRPLSQGAGTDGPRV